MKAPRRLWSLRSEAACVAQNTGDTGDSQENRPNIGDFTREQVASSVTGWPTSTGDGPVTDSPLTGDDTARIGGDGPVAQDREAVPSPVAQAQITGASPVQVAQPVTENGQTHACVGANGDRITSITGSVRYTHTPDSSEIAVEVRTSPPSALLAVLPYEPCHGGCGTPTPHGWHCRACRERLGGGAW